MLVYPCTDAPFTGVLKNFRTSAKKFQEFPDNAQDAVLENTAEVYALSRHSGYHDRFQNKVSKHDTKREGCADCYVTVRRCLNLMTSTPSLKCSDMPTERCLFVCLFAWGLTALSAQIGYIVP